MINRILSCFHSKVNTYFLREALFPIKRKFHLDISLLRINFLYFFIRIFIIVLEANPTPTICPRINCTSEASASNISAQEYQTVNYQIESLNLTCPQSLSNLTIILTVQRTFNEIHNKQNQSFKENTTSMTYKYVTNPSQIIYTWQSLPNMQIDQENFTHTIEIHFNYTSGSMVRTRSNDTWQIWLQSSCGVRQYLNGAYY